MNQYLITEDLLDAIKYEASGLELEVTQRLLGCTDILAEGLADCAKTMYEIERRVRSNPYNPQVERDKVMDEKSCSYLVYQIRVKTGKEGYSCTSEEDTAGSCCRNGRCVFKDGETCNIL